MAVERGAIRGLAGLTLSLLCCSPAFAKPIVAVTLAQATVVTAADGTSHVTPLAAGVAVERGGLIRYTITAKNSGTDPARRLVLTGRIPAGTAFVEGSLHGAGGHAEYSLDSSSFSAQPMVTKTTPSGTTTVPADPSDYVMVRWVKDGALAAAAASAFSYDVRLK